jgi:hypothetical protein
MARYNSSSGSTSINGAATISSPYQGAFTNFTGTAPYTVTLPSPVAFPGSNQTFYNATSGTVTISTPSGLFVGTGASGTSTNTVFAGNVISVTSDGSNYIVISEDGSPLIATTGAFSSDVTINGASASVSIQPSILTLYPGTSGSMDRVAIGVNTKSTGGFTSLTATGQVSFTANTASTSTTTGTISVTGGIGATGNIWSGGTVNATSVVATGLTGTIQTAAQANITSVGTLTSLNVSGQINSAYVRLPITREGNGNLGTYQGYIILAKAYVSGLQAASYVKGYFTISRGSTSNGNKSDIFYVNSQSAYSAESFVVQGSTNGGFWSRTCKVTYGGTVYHAIETGNGGGEPNIGTYFTGEFVNCSPIYTDSTFCSNVTAYGNSNLVNANDGSGWLASGNANWGLGTTTPSLSSGTGLHINNTAGNHANLKLQSTGRTWELLGTSGGYFSLYDTSGGADRLSVTSSGNVGIGITNPQGDLHIYKGDEEVRLHMNNSNYGSSATNGVAIGIERSNNNMFVFNYQNGTLYFGTNSTTRALFQSDGHFRPQNNNELDLGTSGNRWRNVYTNDLNLSNEGKEGGNEVDGTNGSWTVQEGAEDLYLINRKTGKKYRFKLEEL